MSSVIYVIMCVFVNVAYHHSSVSSLLIVVFISVVFISVVLVVFIVVFIILLVHGEVLTIRNSKKAGHQVPMSDANDFR